MQSDRMLDIIATCSKDETRLLITGKESAIGEGNDCTTLQLLASNLVKWEWIGTPIYAKTVMRQLGMAEQVVEWVRKAQDENQKKLNKKKKKTKPKKPNTYLHQPCRERCGLSFAGKWEDTTVSQEGKKQRQGQSGTLLINCDNNWSSHIKSA